MDVEEVPPPKPEYTPEEKERMNYALQKIWPHYRRLAPIIFDEMLTEQEYDSEWTKQTTLGVARVLQQSALSGTALDSVDCYQTLCKVVVTSASEEDYQTFFMQGTLEGPLDAPSHGHRDVLKDGRIQTKAYVSRRTDGSPFVEMKDRMLAYVEREEQAQGDQGTPATDGDHG